MPYRRWADLKTTDFPPANDREAIALLPLAATEQHGPHLPLGTDTLIMEGLLEEAAARCPALLEVVQLPTFSIGKSTEHANFAGSLTFSAATMLTMLAEVVAGIVASGYHKLVFVSSHGGNAEVMALAMQEAREKHGVIAAQCSWRRFGRPEGLFAARENSFGIHGGDYETSLMLHFAPHLVDMDRATDFPASAEDIAANNTHLRLFGPLSIGWMAEDNHPFGVVGEAHLATPEKGAVVAGFQAERFLAFLGEVAAHPLP